MLRQDILLAVHQASKGTAAAKALLIFNHVIIAIAGRIAGRIKGCKFQDCPCAHPMAKHRDKSCA